ncbi:hypothetical protein [Sandaracinus amylolyticus]|uniref:hypothetical protein n=1 Tax=Sandaracinus amylolyticus TaxID=927083 RepID=UPI001F367C31|nr:hypothetical protein [Sandaracinus amylolyticus]UJR81317.1 Hypothetical protein I5071_33740 [Sandaracinus amylolyticus]
MTSPDLLAEARALTRPCLHLRPESPGALVAVFYGDAGFDDAGDDDPGEIPWITVDLSAHPDTRVARDACLEVRADIGSGRGSAALAPLGALQGEHGRGVPLRATPSREMPPLDALFIEGGDAIGTWLDGLGWKREWGMNDNFRDLETAYAYERAWSANHALCGTNDAWAQLGGWPLTWPDEPYRAQRKAILVLRTYRASEPWIEVLQMPDGKHIVRARIT